MSLSLREQILLLALIIICLFYCFNKYLYQPLQDDTARLATENAQLENMINSEQERVVKSRNLQKQRRKLEEEYQQMMVKVPEHSYIPEIISFLENNALDSSVTLNKINYRREEKSVGATKEPDDKSISNYQPCTLEISVRGNYFNLLSFLMKIEQSPRIYIINGGSFIASEKKMGSRSQPLDSENDAIIPSPAVPLEAEGSVRFDSNNLTMKLQLTAYYDPTSSTPDISGMPEKVPPGEGRENPFQY